MSLKQTSRFLSFKVLNFVSLKLGKFFKFRTLEVMKLRGVYRGEGPVRWGILLALSINITS